MESRLAIRAIMAAVAVAAVIVVSCGVVSAVSRHKVGGPLGWTPGINFTEWASDKHIYAGDWLYFVFDKNAHDVLEVNETGYEACSGQGFITNITRGGRDVYQLNETKTYYFICGKGYCWQGMKLAVNVLELPPPAPAPSSSGSSGSANLLCWRSRIGVALVVLVSWVFGAINL
ncbi:hypothetical protein MLD38_024515 [Melastoma candidum]|uniref:Uncharacterized protein n=1 Tax=Melastoma candidum TaxID=119954 RepID=A0ACB9NU34_9MYRT|nr:hypothetical protein MLD38_024515 [Melastoma candidum]